MTLLPRRRGHRRVLTALFAAAALAVTAWPPAAQAQDGGAFTRAERDSLWVVAMAVPDGPDREFRFRSVHGYQLGLSAGWGMLVCGTLEFDDADAGIVNFALRYDVGAQGRLQPGMPVFYGQNWLRGSVEPADRCAAAEAGP